MSKHGSGDGGSHRRRTSLFSLSSLTQINPVREEQSSQSAKPPRRRKAPPVFTNLDHPDLARDDLRSPSQASASPKRRPSFSMRGGSQRTASVLGSLRSMRSSGDDDLPLTATSSKSPSVNWGDYEGMIGNTKNVLHHGEVQTSSGMFRKKKEYLVLTETHIVRCKSQAKASESFSGVPSPFGRSPTVHRSTTSYGSAQDLQSLHSDSSGDKDGRVSLRQVVAAHRLDDGKPYFAIEVCYLDEESSQASGMTLQLADPEDRDTWLRAIRSAANEARVRDAHPISAYNSRYVARVVERENDYDPENFAMYKVVQRQSPKSGSRSSTDDLSKIASTVCFLAIGIHKVHLIPIVKATSRSSTPSLVSSNLQGSYGILTLTGVKLSNSDDSFELTFRQPLQRTKTLYLASLASPEVAMRLHIAENVLRPECGYRLYEFTVPKELEDHLPPPVSSDEEELCCLDRTLTAYCIAYGVSPANIRYTINYLCEDAPRFELLPVADPRRRAYSILELLAVMRTLRYNESFGSISFAEAQLDALNGLHDNHGGEHVCTRTKRGTPIRLSADELGRSCLLVQEIRALAATSKKLRRMDFSGCISTKPPEYNDEGLPKTKDIGCGIVEALFPLCKHQTTNVDWISLSGITLSETDLDYLVAAAVDKACHFRALELSRCGLSDRSLGLIMDALRAQDNTLEALDISGNLARLSPAVFDSQISVFGFIRKLNLSNVSRTSGPESILSADTLLTWRLEELKLSGTAINHHTVEALAEYLRSPQSEPLHELALDHAFLTGSEIATLMRAMTRESGPTRNLHLDISHNNIIKDHDQLTSAIAENCAPTHLSLRAIEYRDENIFRHLIMSLRVNRSIQYLDISRASLPCDASEETSHALERMFAENDVLEELDISGEDSRLEISKFGVGLNTALSGLKYNKSLHVLRIQYQKLGLPGAGMLAEVLKENDTLRELHCEHNDIPLSALTDMINALFTNTTLVYMPLMEEGRSAALKQTEREVKYIRDEPISPRKPSSPVVKPSSSFGVRRGLANMKKNANRTASAYTPSFPSFQSSRSSSRSTSSPLMSSSHFSFSSSPKTKQNASSPVAAPLPQLTDQDIQAALRLVSESWDRQQYRLQQYLQRNWCILQGIPTAMEIQEEEFERPASVGSLSKVLERVKYDSTPRAEKELDFGPDFNDDPDIGSLIHGDNDNTASFEKFLLDSGSSSPTETRSPDEMRSPDLEMAFSQRGDEPKTPTQKGFFG